MSIVNAVPQLTREKYSEHVKKKYSIAPEEFEEYENYIETKTDLYKFIYLDFPWWQLVRVQLKCEQHHREYIKQMGSFDKDQLFNLRKRDFLKKKELVLQNFDVVFMVKCPMYRGDHMKYENKFMIELYEEHLAKGDKILIIDSAGMSELSLRYLKSKYNKYTIPYEGLMDLFLPNWQEQKEKIFAVFKREIEGFAAANHKNTPKEYMMATIKIYASLKDYIYHTFLLRSFFREWGVKRFYGGMASEWATGYNNPWEVVEVGHGINRRFLKFGEAVGKFYRERFDMTKVFYKYLAPSGVKDYFAGDDLYLTENSTNYGMPELRCWRKEDRTKIINKLKRKFNLGEKKVVVICTTNNLGNDIELINKIAERCAEEGFDVIIRPHPSYDSPTIYKPEHCINIAYWENKYDILYLADYVLSAPSSIADEAAEMGKKTFILNVKDKKRQEENNFQYPNYPKIDIYDLDNIIRVLNNEVINDSRFNRISDKSSCKSLQKTSKEDSERSCSCGL